MKYKNLVPTIVGMVMVILLSGCVSENSIKEAKINTDNVNKKTENSSLENIPNNKITKQELEDFIFAEGFDSPEYYQQMKENAEMLQMNIVTQEVYNTNSSESCNKLKKESQKTGCKDSFYMSQAIKKEDTVLCDKISQKESQKYCKQMTISQSARKSNNVEICNAIEDQYAKKDCKNSIYIETAKKTGSTKSCNNIEEEGFKTMCIQEAKFAKEEKARREKMNIAIEETETLEAPETLEEQKAIETGSEAPEEQEETEVEG